MNINYHIQASLSLCVPVSSSITVRYKIINCGIVTSTTADLTKHLGKKYKTFGCVHVYIFSFILSFSCFLSIFYFSSFSCGMSYILHFVSVLVLFHLQKVVLSFPILCIEIPFTMLIQMRWCHLVGIQKVLEQKGSIFSTFPFHCHVSCLKAIWHIHKRNTRNLNKTNKLMDCGIATPTHDRSDIPRQVPRNEGLASFWNE